MAERPVAQRDEMTEMTVARKSRLRQRQRVLFNDVEQRVDAVFGGAQIVVRQPHAVVAKDIVAELSNEIVQRRPFRTFGIDAPHVVVAVALLDRRRNN